MNFKELEELINSGVKEISLTEDVMSEGNYEDGIIICTDGLIIDGNNHKIDANSLGRIFIVEAKNVTLKNIVFVNGKTNGGGGAIVNYDVNLRIINCCFKNNLTNGGILLRILGGGAIGSYSDMSLYNCKFENNSAFGDNGGAIYNENMDLVLYDCRFEDNALSGWNNFSDNESIFNGGVLSLNNCCFTAKSEGYFIFNVGQLIIDDINLDSEDSILNKGSLELIS